VERHVKVAIIGAGTAGLNALSQVRKVTDSFVLINGGELGTTCARVGCMPSKALIQVAEDFHRRHVYERHGTRGAEALAADLPEALEYVRDLRDHFVDRVLSSSTDEMGEELVEGYARFLEPDLLDVEGQLIRAERIVIATGSRPYVPEAWEGLRDRLITTDELFEQDTLPSRLAVIGLGVIGMELGQALARLGLEVTGIDRLDTVAGLQDPVVRQAAVEQIGREMPLWLGAAAELEAAGEGLRIRAGEHVAEVDRALISVGRIPNLDRLGLERIGVALDARGIPVYNPNTMQVGDLPIFIAGDVTGDRPILHEAGDEGRIAGFNAVHEPVRAFRRKPHLAITFCHPNVATVGARWDELDHERIAVGAMRFAPVGRALIMARNHGVVRIYADRASGRLLGAELVGPEGEHLAHFLALALSRELTVYDLLKTPFYHPTLEETLQAALYDLLGKLDHQGEVPVELQPL